MCDSSRRKAEQDSVSVSGSEGNKRSWQGGDAGDYVNKSGVKVLFILF
jgi:hypothetical protein